MAFTNWLSRANRAGGEYNTPNVTIPTGINRITVQLNLLANSDFSTPDKSLTITIEISRDSAVTWETHCVIGWIGGAPSQKSGRWSATIDGIGALTGFLARAHVSQSGSFRWGLRGEIA
jgi:hypothetical protein